VVIARETATVILPSMMTSKTKDCFLTRRSIRAEPDQVPAYDGGLGTDLFAQSRTQSEPVPGHSWAQTFSCPLADKVGLHRPLLLQLPAPTEVC
jgi:hypothetical protein